MLHAIAVLSHTWDAWRMVRLGLALLSMSRMPWDTEAEGELVVGLSLEHEGLLFAFFGVVEYGMVLGCALVARYGRTCRPCSPCGTCVWVAVGCGLGGHQLCAVHPK